VAPLAERLDGAPLHVLDTRVIDQHCLPYRKRVSENQGARQLITLAQVYELPWLESEAHGCAYDAVMAARVLYRIGSLAHTTRESWPEAIRTARRPRFDELAGLAVPQLHDVQAKWAAEQAAGLQEHFRKSDPEAVVNGSWPLIPRQGGAA
jgi:DNA polymerase-3 subunit epsilon